MNLRQCWMHSCLQMVAVVVVKVKNSIIYFVDLFIFNNHFIFFRVPVALGVNQEYTLWDLCTLHMHIHTFHQPACCWEVGGNERKPTKEEHMKLRTEQSSDPAALRQHYSLLCHHTANGTNHSFHLS